MNTRVALYGWIARHGLDRRGADALFRLAGYDAEPAAVARRFWPAVAVLAAALAGLGVILWLAANWDDLGRTGRFVLLQGAVVATCAGAALHARARPAFGLLAFVCIGGLFAYFGQTYQTGADPWQLFALWALLGLPLCLAARSDVLWAPWALVVSVGISLWIQAHTGHRWRVEPQDVSAYAVGWCAAALLVAALGPAAARFTGAGVWSLRTAGTCAVLLVTIAALLGLFHQRVAPHYPIALVLLAACAAALATRRGFDVFLLSAVALALDALLVGGAGRLLFERNGVHDEAGRFLLLGLMAAGLLAATVSLVMRVARRHG